MQITIDTDKLTWTEVAGKPTLGSFLQAMTNQQSRGKDSPAAKLPSIFGWVLVKLERPSYAPNNDLGLVPTGTCTDYRVLQFPQVIHNSFQQEFTTTSSERIVAFSNDISNAIVRTINVLHAADRAAAVAAAAPPAPVAAPPAAPVAPAAAPVPATPST